MKTVQNGAYYLRRGENTMQRTLVSSQAWDVPNSNLVVNLKKFHEYSWIMFGSGTKALYSAGVSVKRRVSSDVGYSLFNETGEDPYSAFEHLLGMIDKSVDVVFRIVDVCEHPESVETVKVVGYDEPPLRGDDFATKFFSSISRMIALMERSEKDFRVVMRSSRNETGHAINYGAICVGDEVVFKGLPAYEKSNAIGNVRMAAIGAAALLEKLQGMAWNVMIDSDDAQYDVVMDCNSLVLKKKDAVGN